MSTTTTKKKGVHSLLAEIQKELKAPKGQRNTFGKYNYRSAEDILEAVKPLSSKRGLAVTISDEVVEVGTRIYVKSTVKLSSDSDCIESVAFAREPEDKKGMDSAQITGATSSYARKYAMNGLFAIDDTKDADATNVGSDEAPQKRSTTNVNRQAPAPADVPEENIMDKAVGYIKQAADKHKAFDSIMKKYESSMTQGQITGLKKFVR
tara:strand:- start:41 stop:664 length:624 start_codon:yes stop_codon:yes gene_type:complete